jgi:error-prone DNA polymerase
MVKRACDFLAEHKGMSLDLATIPAEIPRAYLMICKPNYAPR